MHFFHLPEDVQVLIVQQWLVGAENDKQLLRTLSMLDLSSCRGSRQAFVALAGHPALRWSSNGQAMRAVVDIPSCMAWLHSRHVALRALACTTGTAGSFSSLQQRQSMLPWGKAKAPPAHFTLDSIEHLHIALHNPVDEAQYVLDRCPNLTSLENQATLPMLLELSTLVQLLPRQLRLKRLILHGFWANGISDVLDAFGHLLEVLRLDNITIRDEDVSVLAQCKHLRVLELDRLLLSCEQMKALFDACSQLNELIVWSLQCTNADLLDALRPIWPQLKHFEWWRTSPSFLPKLVGLGGQSSVRIGSHCLFDPSSRHLSLEMSDMVLEPAFMDPLFLACGPIVKFTIVQDCLYFRDMTRIANAVCSTLQDLTFDSQFTHLQYLLPVILPCQQLLRLTLLEVAVTDEGIEQVAVHCRQLQFVHIGDVIDLGSTSISDIAVMALFANCSDLKVLRVGNVGAVTRVSLQFLLHCKLRLEEFAWSSVAFTQEDVAWFRKQARDSQALPVPRLVGKVDSESAMLQQHPPRDCLRALLGPCWC